MEKSILFKFFIVGLLILIASLLTTNIYLLGLSEFVCLSSAIPLIIKNLKSKP